MILRCLKLENWSLSINVPAFSVGRTVVPTEETFSLCSGKKQLFFSCEGSNKYCYGENM